VRAFAECGNAGIDIPRSIWREQPHRLVIAEMPNGRSIRESTKKRSFFAPDRSRFRAAARLDSPALEKRKEKGRQIRQGGAKRRIAACRFKTRIGASVPLSLFFSPSLSLSLSLMRPANYYDFRNLHRVSRACCFYRRCRSFPTRDVPF